MDINKYRKQFGKNIRNFRKKQNLTLEELADKSNLNFKYLSGVERGVYNISFDNIIKIAEALSIKPHLLFIFPNMDSNNIYFTETLSLISDISPQHTKLINKLINVILNN